MTAHALLTLGTSPTRLSPFGTHSGIDFTIQNVNASGYIYIGSSNVSSGSYGFRIDPSHAISLELNGRDGIYAVASTSGLQVSTLSVALEQGS